MKHLILKSLTTVLLALPVRALTTFTVTNINDSGPGSLRQAMLAVNAAGASTQELEYVIQFAIPGAGVRTIRPTSALPEIRLHNQVVLTIAGGSQPGYSSIPLIELNGELAGTANGLQLGSGRMVVQGLIVNRFNGHGIYSHVADPFDHEANRTLAAIKGCWIGLASDGLSAAGNSGNGLQLHLANGSYDSSVGGPGANEGNVISGNGGDGIRLVAEDSIDYYEFTYSGCVVEHNFIGTNRHGLAKVPNGGTGVTVTWDTQFQIWPRGLVVIGGLGSERRNVIAGNKGSGLTIHATSEYEVQVKGNYIGLGSDGQTTLGNGQSGVLATNENVTIGGTVFGEGNVISGNDGPGVSVFGEWVSDSPETVLLGNYIGTDSTGTAARPNQGAGVKIDTIAMIGSTTSPESGINYICANVGGGVRLESSYADISGARIGVGPGGQALGNLNAGIFCAGGGVNVRRSVIANNAVAGIRLTGNVHSTVEDNWIGVTAAGQPAGNAGPGVLVTSVARDEPFFWDGVMIGGKTAGTGNRIAYNSGAGVASPLVAGQEPTRRLTIRRNEMYANGGPGIELGESGPQANDPLDADDGVNRGQNIPVLQKVTATKVVGYLESAPQSEYTVECFLAEADGTGYGEGRSFLGSVNLTTDAAGRADFALSNLQIPQGARVTATATALWRSPGNHTSPDLSETSEFSANLPVTPEPGDLTISGTQSVQNLSESTPAAQVVVQRTGGSTGSINVAWSLLPGTATPDADYQNLSGILTFPHGVTRQTITVPLFDDAMDEGVETFSVKLSNPTTGSIIVGPGTAELTIIDNDLPPVVSIAPGPSVPEGNSGIGVIPFTVTLSAPSAFSVSVNYATASGTATGGFDFVHAEGTLTFAPGESSKEIPVDVYADLLAETDETVLLNISTPVNAVLGVAQGEAVIIDEDLPGTLGFEKTAVSVTESTEAKAVKVVRTRGSAGTVTVAYQVTGGTATMGTDYTSFATSGTLTFLQGETTKNIVLYPLEDQSLEGNETIVIQLSSPTGGAVMGSAVQSTLTIVDNDTAPSISGRVESSTPGFDPAAATVTLVDAASPASPVRVNPDWSGNYAFTGLMPGHSYTVRVTADGWSFTPDTQTFSRIKDSAVDVSFLAMPEVFPDLHMSAQPDGSTLLYWPATSSGWTPMMSADLTNWTAVPGTVQTSAPWNSIKAPAGNRLFFRLSRGGGTSNES